MTLKWSQSRLFYYYYYYHHHHHHHHRRRRHHHHHHHHHRRRHHHHHHHHHHHPHHYYYLPDFLYAVLREMKLKPLTSLLKRVISRHCEMWSLYSVAGRWMNEYEVLVEWYWQGKYEVLRETPTFVLVRVLKISHKLAWYWTQTSVVGFYFLGFPSIRANGPPISLWDFIDQ